MSDDSLEVRRVTLEALREKLAVTVKAREAANQDEAVRRYLSLLRGCELLTEAVAEAEKAVARAKVGAPDIAQPVVRKPTTARGARLRAAYQIGRTGGPLLGRVNMGGTHIRVYREPYRRMLDEFRGRTVTAKEVRRWFGREYGVGNGCRGAYIQFGRQDGTILPALGKQARQLSFAPSKYGDVVALEDVDETRQDPEELRKAGLLR